MTDSGNVSGVAWNNTNKTGEVNYQPQTDYYKLEKDKKAEELAKSSIFTYAASYRG